MDAKLFRRLTTGSELTPAGERFLDVAERMEADMIAARSEVAGEGEDVSGTVRIGAPDGFGVAFLAPRLGALTALHRELKIQLVPVPRSFSLSRREADIAITTERPTEGRLVAAKLVDYSLGLFASRAYAEAHGLPADAGRTSAHRLIGYVPDLVISPSLAYAAEFSPDWDAGFCDLVGARPGRGGAFGRRHRHPAHLHRALHAGTRAGRIAASRSAAPTGWSITKAVRPLRRIQAVAGFITKAVERERQLFL